MKILLFEDELQVVQFIKKGLSEKAINVSTPAIKQ
jgi:DNA-binding response OmpR family regulator